MPEGPFGFPRLTTLGPFVKPSSIQPAENVSEGVYDLSYLYEVQEITARDTERALDDIIEHDLDLGNQFRPKMDVTFRYRKAQISDLLDINEFSSSLLEGMSRAEEEGIPLTGVETDRLMIENDRLEEEIRAHMNGEASIFTDSILSGIDANWGRVANDKKLWRSESEIREEVVEKTIEDFHGVMEINETIRDEHIYYPPTTESIELGAPVGWGTIDGAHRLVALSQIIGTDEEIYIWEWDNQQMFINESPVF